MPILSQAITWLGIFVVALSLAALMRTVGFDWPATIFATVVAFFLLPFAVGWWRGNLFAKPRGKISPKVDKSTTPYQAQPRPRYGAKDLSTFLQDFQALPTEALQILSAYASLSEDFPDCVIDTTWLPADKEKMKDVLKLSWLRATTDEARNWVETGWYLLSWFQDGVGRIPIPVLRAPPISIPIGAAYWSPGRTRHLVPAHVSRN